MTLTTDQLEFIILIPALPNPASSEIDEEENSADSSAHAVQVSSLQGNQRHLRLHRLRQSVSRRQESRQSNV